MKEPIRSKHKHEHNQDEHGHGKHEHNHDDHVHNHDNHVHDMTRRKFLTGVAAVLGIGAVAVVSPSIIETLTTAAAPELIIETDRQSLHRPEEHYCKLEVFRNKMVFKKNCCSPLTFQGVTVDGMPADYKIRKTNPLEVEILNGGRGKTVNIDVREGQAVRRYTFMS